MIFLLPLDSRHDGRQHELLVANCLAQGEALMQGETNTAEPHRHFDGNRPSTTILYDRLDPYTLGMLLALYEHKTFAEAAIWGINPFDQWGSNSAKTWRDALRENWPALSPRRPATHPRNS